MSDDKTIGIYNARAEDYQSALQPGKPEADVQAFLDALPAGARVLDLGCGPGGHAGQLAWAGLQVEAWDASDQMVALAAQVPGVAARRAEFSDLVAECRYDGIMARFSLLHAPMADLPTHLAAIATALKPGGVFSIGMKTGTGEGRDRLGRFYAYYQPDALSSLLASVGLTETSRTMGEGKGLAGDIEPWVVIQALRDKVRRDG